MDVSALGAMQKAVPSSRHDVGHVRAVPTMIDAGIFRTFSKPPRPYIFLWLHLTTRVEMTISSVIKS